ncbi:hypothetical protein J6590_011106 [Homalodisca vitripennis]|nr:hypothetical protein J6590_011106 [Homalodisca vitripennis]
MMSVSRSLYCCSYPRQDTVSRLIATQSLQNPTLFSINNSSTFLRHIILFTNRLLPQFKQGFIYSSNILVTAGPWQGGVSGQVTVYDCRHNFPRAPRTPGLRDVRCWCESSGALVGSGDSVKHRLLT